MIHAITPFKRSIFPPSLKMPVSQQNLLTQMPRVAFSCGFSLFLIENMTLCCGFHSRCSFFSTTAAVSDQLDQISPNEKLVVTECLHFIQLKITNHKKNLKTFQNFHFFLWTFCELLLSKMSYLNVKATQFGVLKLIRFQKNFMIESCVVWTKHIRLPPYGVVWLSYAHSRKSQDIQ